MNAEEPAIGIDLGTTYSCVGVLINGKIEIIPNEHGYLTSPSYIAFTDTEILFGKAAKDQITINANNTVYDVKRLIGRKFDDEDVMDDKKRWSFDVVEEEINNKPRIKIKYKEKDDLLYPEEISAMMLSYMKETAEAYLGKRVVNAVITVPAYFNDSQRQITKDAGTIAGLNVMQIINEPTAAAVAYGADKPDLEGKNILIFDLGGGTCDVSIVTVEKNAFQVISTNGDTHLGGEDFDNCMVDCVVHDFRQEYNVDLTHSKKSLIRLRKACEEAKRTLSTATYADIKIDALHKGIDLCLKISRAKFEDANKHLFQKAMTLVKKSLENVGMSAAEIDEVVLVGGSTRIPKVQKMLQDLFDGKPLNKSMHPDEAVAYGAAVQAAILSGNVDERVKNTILKDVTPLSLGIETRGTSMCVIIPRNTPIPVKKTHTVTTTRDRQTSAFIRVYEGEYPLTKFNNFLDEFRLDCIPPAPAGVSKIDVTFAIDRSGILTVKAVQPISDTEKIITVTNSRGRLDIEQVQTMIIKAEKYKAEAAERKKANSSMNELESYYNEVIEFIDAKENNLCEGDRIVIEEKCDQMAVLLSGPKLSAKDEYERGKTELKKVFEAIRTKINRPIELSTLSSTTSNFSRPQ